MGASAERVVREASGHVAVGAHGALVGLAAVAVPGGGAAVAHLGRDVEIGVVTRGARGSLILAGGKCAVVEAERVDKVVDQTGAGELYAAGFLYGLCRGMDLAAAGRLGSFAAADIVRIVGARPETKLGHLARMRGLIH